MPSFLISDTRVFDGERVIHDHGYVLVENNSITAVCTVKPALLPMDCVIVQGSGCTVLPGLIDAHVHAYNDVSFLEKAIQYGVTTVLDMHDEPHWFQNLKEIADKRNDISDIRSACYAATIKNGWPSTIVQLSSPDPDASTVDRISKWPNITDVASAEEYVAKNVAAGASYIKLMEESGHTFNLPSSILPIPTPSIEVQRAVVEAAHKHGMLAIAHAISERDTLRMLEVGVDGLAHGCIDALSQELIGAFGKYKPFVVPTLVVHASTTGEEQDSRERFARGLTKSEQEHMCGCLNISRQGLSMKNTVANIQVLKAAGIEIVCGTDTSNHLKGLMVGASLHHELWLYVNRCGLTPSEALQSATSVTARRLRLPDRGRLREGLKADLILVKGDPTVSIDCLTEIVDIWRNGDRLKRSLLDL